MVKFVGLILLSIAFIANANDSRVYGDIYDGQSVYETTTKKTTTTTTKVYGNKQMENIYGQVYQKTTKTTKAYGDNIYMQNVYETTARTTTTQVYDENKYMDNIYGQVYETRETTTTTESYGNEGYENINNNYDIIYKQETTTTKSYAQNVNVYGEQEMIENRKQSNIYGNQNMVNVYGQQEMKEKREKESNVYENQKMNIYAQQNQYNQVYNNIRYGYRVPNVKCSVKIDLTALPGNCRKFRRCSNGILYIMNCPANLVFDNRIKVCNYPQNVQAPCGTQKRPIYTNIYHNQKYVPNY